MNSTVSHKAGKKKPSILSTAGCCVPSDEKAHRMPYANQLETEFVPYAKQLETLFSLMWLF